MNKNTPQEDRLIFLENKEYIGFLYKRKNLQIKQIAKKFNIIPHRLSAFIAKEEWVRDFNNIDVIKDLHFEQKYQVGEMAEILNCSVDSIRRSLRRFNLEVLHEVRYGSMSRYSFNESFFEVIDTKEKAYWLGIILADGCVTHSFSRAKDKYGEKRYDRLTITIARRDEPHLIKFKEAIGYNGIIERGTTNSFGGIHEYSRLRITSEKLCNDLIDKNIMPNKSTNEIPYKLPRELKRAYIRGYFDGDGYVAVYNNSSKETIECEFGFLGSNEILEYIKEFLVEEGMELNFNIKEAQPDSPLLKFRSGGVNATQSFYNILYKGSTIEMERKSERFKNYLIHKERYSPSFTER